MLGGVPHPIAYQGSKRRLAAAILRYAPSRVARLVEPFAGSAAISLAAAAGGRAGAFWLNDAHTPLARLWREILKHPARLADRYEAIWLAQQGRERAYFDEVRDRFNASRRPEDFLFLLARCVKAAVRYNAAGDFNNTPDNRRRGTRPDEMRRRLKGASKLLAGQTVVTEHDYRVVLERCTAEDLIYMDPPYQGVVASRDSRYAPRIDREEFIACLETLNERGCRYLVSYDGRTGEKRFGEPLPASLRLAHVELAAGRSSQATLLGRVQLTFESLYVSPTLARKSHSRRLVG